MKKNKVFIIAEAGVNHNGSLKRAFALVKSAKKCGADAIKFQLFNKYEQISKNAPTAPYQKKETRKTNMLEMAKFYDLNWDEHIKIKKLCDKIKIEYIASCFDKLSVDFYLKEIKGKIIKIASSEIDNSRLLKYINTLGKEVILSTGMSNLEEIIYAKKLLKKIKKLTLMQCTSVYPTIISDVNLNFLNILKNKFNCKIGFSDHSLSDIPSLVSVGAGCQYIEKHFTLSKKLKGPDHSMSLNIQELKRYIKNIRTAEKALGSEKNKPTKKEKKLINFSRRGLFSARTLKKGTIIKKNDIVYKRPAFEMSIKDEKKIVGKKLKKNLEIDEAFRNTFF